MNRLTNPDEIYAASFAIIRAEADLGHLAPEAHGIAERIIHACGMSEIAPDLRISSDAAQAMHAAFRARRAIIADCEMVRNGIIPRAVPQGMPIVCTLNDPRSRALGQASGTTRSAAAVWFWDSHLEGAIVAIGNAPTALFALLEALDKGAKKPACIIGLPVGFVGASEAKAELAANPRGIPFVTLLGRRGGSAMAAAAVNAIGLELAP